MRQCLVATFCCCQEDGWECLLRGCALRASLYGEGIWSGQGGCTLPPRSEKEQDFGSNGRRSAWLGCFVLQFDRNLISEDA